MPSSRRSRAAAALAPAPVLTPAAPVVALPPAAPSSPWLTVREAARHARVGVKCIYREVAASRLRAARVGNRRDLRLRAEWIDAWLTASATPIEVHRG
jgi:excisionase family DNA binding protein